MRVRLLTTGIVVALITGVFAVCASTGGTGHGGRLPGVAAGRSLALAATMVEMDAPPPIFTDAPAQTGTIMGTTKSCLIGTGQCYTGETTVCSSSCMYVGDEVELDTSKGKRVLTAPVNRSHFTLHVRPGHYRVVVLFRSLTHPRHGKGKPYGPGHRVNALSKPVAVNVGAGTITHVTLKVIQPAIG